MTEQFQSGRLGPDEPVFFQKVLGDAWHDLPQEVRSIHNVRAISRHCGRAEVERGTSPLARLVGWVAGLPLPSNDVPVTVTMHVTVDGEGEVWERNFAGRAFSSTFTHAPSPKHYRESVGPFTFELKLDADGDGIQLDVCGGWAFGVPLPRWAWPASRAREFVRDGRYYFDVQLSAPLAMGMLVRYRGWLVPQLINADATAHPER